MISSIPLSIGSDSVISMHRDALARDSVRREKADVERKELARESGLGNANFVHVVAGLIQKLGYCAVLEEK